ncbi:uracil-DNA glycosylase [archaeon SCG-AAA382B04]|nr:uracil-DNA glycosylase [archaeon SCG-AAA382B04]
MNNKEIRHQIGIKNCTKCSLSENRNNIVVGEGKTNADILLIGEAPGKREDEKGRPFVGRAGETLTELLNHIGLKREDIYITNIVKCKPPSNRNPKPEEMEACEQYLKQQIEIINPSIIISVGKVATQRLLSRKVTLKNHHGTITETTEEYGKNKLFITYHPAACLYNKNLEETLKEDFEKLNYYIEILNNQ